MIEKSGAGPVWRPTMAPHPVKNLVIEPMAVYKVASSGWVEGDVQFFDNLTLDVVLSTRNMGSRPVKEVTVNAQLYFGGQRVKSIVERTGEVPAGYEATTTLDAVNINAKQSVHAKAFLDHLNKQDPTGQIIAPITVDADFITPLNGPLKRVMVGNARSVTKGLPIQTRSGSPARLLV